MTTERPATRRACSIGVSILLVLLPALLLAGCTSEREATPTPLIPADEHDPAVWGQSYPDEYERWLATKDKRPADKSLYKRGFDGGVVFDKLSEFPFMPLLFNGWGFGIDYNEPRGHWWMLIDQQEVDPSRVKAGGACLTCKSPYAEDLYQRDKDALFAAKYTEAVAMLPADAQQLGVSCIDCHDPTTLALSTRRWTVDAGLKDLGLKKSDLSRNQMRLLVCGQCHCTYSVMKDGAKSVDVDFPWEGGEWGAITVEDIIANLESQKPRLEWTQAVTGFKLGFIRHPDFEFFSDDSIHYRFGLTCNDCHMPRLSVGAAAGDDDHNVMSPLKLDMVACQRCHGDTAEQRRAKVLSIQEQTLGMLIDAGYRVATVAKLFQLANASLETTSGDPAYDDAAGLYRQAFYRVLYMGAENSVGFHNPMEASRILYDATTSADKAEATLRKLLASKGVAVPAEVPLELEKYLTDRGVKKLNFNKGQYIPDPFGHAQENWPQSLGELVR